MQVRPTYVVPSNLPCGDSQCYTNKTHQLLVEESSVAILSSLSLPRLDLMEKQHLLRSHYSMQHQSIQKTDESRQHCGKRHEEAHAQPLSQYRCLPQSCDTDSLTRATLLKLPALNGGDDYVRRWLAKANAEVNKEGSGYFDASVTHPSDKLDGRERSQEFLTIRQIPQRIPSPDTVTKPKQRHYSTSDSSLLREPQKKIERIVKKDAERNIIKRKREEPLHQNDRRQTNVSMGSEFSSSIPPKLETFEKRSRYKTREGRYEPKDGTQPARAGSVEKRPRSKRPKRGDQLRQAKKVSDGLMHSYSSKSLGRERLTIPPSHGPGLFMNGRVSSLNSRHGVPDLAFSEMKFLEKASHRLQSPERGHRMLLKQSKKGRKLLKAQDEIPTYFQPRKRPLREIVHSRGAPSPVTISEPSRGAKKKSQHNDSRSCYEARKLSTPDITIVGLAKHMQSIDKPIHRGYSDHYNAPISPHGLLGTATSYISWSETQPSAGVKAHQRWTSPRDGTRRSASPTCSQAQFLIEDSGIFLDTGISRKRISEYLHAASLSQCTDVQDISNKQDTHQVMTLESTANVGFKSNTTKGTLVAYQPQDSCQERHYAGQVPSNHQIRESVKKRVPAFLEKSAAKNQMEMVTVGNKVEQCERHKQPCAVRAGAFIGSSILDAKPVPTASCPPLTRDQMAKNARIRLQSKSVPLGWDKSAGLGVSLDLKAIEDKANIEPVMNDSRRMDDTAHIISRQTLEQAIFQPHSTSTTYLPPVGNGDYWLSTTGKQSNFHYNTSSRRLELGNNDNLEHDLQQAEVELSSWKNDVDETLPPTKLLEHNQIALGTVENSDPLRLRLLLEEPPLFLHQIQPQTTADESVYARKEFLSADLEQFYERQFWELHYPFEGLINECLHEEECVRLASGREVSGQSPLPELEHPPYCFMEKVDAANVLQDDLIHLNQDQFYQGSFGNYDLGIYNQHAAGGIEISRTAYNEAKVSAQPNLYQENGGSGEMKRFWQPRRQY